MKFVPTMTVAAVGLLVAGVAGCGGSKYAPVSGVVTLNGKPYGKAVVSFQPHATKDNPNPGRGSSGYTDENGRFTLKSDDGHEGAVVGNHRIRIMTRRDNTTGEFDPEVGSPDLDPKARPRGFVEPIPPEWYATSTKDFEVPAGGTDQANFDIVNKKK
jgi:hypothetical protein